MARPHPKREQGYAMLRSGVRPSVVAARCGVASYTAWRWADALDLGDGFRGMTERQQQQRREARRRAEAQRQRDRRRRENRQLTRQERRQAAEERRARTRDPDMLRRALALADELGSVRLAASQLDLDPRLLFEHHQRLQPPPGQARPWASTLERTSITARRSTLFHFTSRDDAKRFRAWCRQLNLSPGRLRRRYHDGGWYVALRIPSSVHHALVRLAGAADVSAEALALLGAMLATSTYYAAHTTELGALAGGRAFSPAAVHELLTLGIIHRELGGPWVLRQQPDHITARLGPRSGALPASRAELARWLPPAQEHAS